MSENQKLVEGASVLREGKKILACAQALILSQGDDISPREIGDSCNRHGIKIVAGQLGCFE